jgi:pyruvate dehydrogenase E2 component (dihydrolipoamide acetyltransferase)
MNALLVLGIVTLVIYGILVDGTFFKIYLPLVGAYWFVSAVLFKTNDPIWKRRRIAMASWSAPGEPTSYMPAEYDVTETMEYLEKLNKGFNDGTKITLTYLVTKALGIALTASIDHVGRLALGHFRRVDQVDITVLTDVNGGKDLIPINVKAPHNKSLAQISKDIQERADKARKGKDEQHKKNTQAVEFLPSFLVGPLLAIIPYITLNLGWDVPLIGAKGNMFSPIVLTNVGSLGLTAGFAPMPPLCAEIVACMGKVVDRPWVVNGEIKIRKILTIVYSFDHRFGDGAVTVKALKYTTKCLENAKIMETLKYNNNDLLNGDVFDDKKKN